MTKQKLIFLVLQNLLSRFLFESYWWVEGECFMISFSVSCITTLSSIVFVTTLMENINSKNRSISIVSKIVWYLVIYIIHILYVQYKIYYIVPWCDSRAYMTCKKTILKCICFRTLEMHLLLKAKLNKILIPLVID